MKNRRMPAHQVTPQYEDSGLFKRELRQIPLELMAIFDRNNRGDLLIQGVASPNSMIELVIPGRRVKNASALVERLGQIRNEAQRDSNSKLSTGQERRRARLPVNVLGSWRLRFVPDDKGWEVKIYQVLAAQWTFVDAKGNLVANGRPVVEQQETVLVPHSSVIRPGLTRYCPTSGTWTAGT